MGSPLITLFHAPGPVIVQVILRTGRPRGFPRWRAPMTPCPPHFLGQVKERGGQVAGPAQRTTFIKILFPGNQMTSQLGTTTSPLTLLLIIMCRDTTGLTGLNPPPRR